MFGIFNFLGDVILFRLDAWIEKMWRRNAKYVISQQCVL